MIKIGITGNIGSGKSTVCKVFALLGVTAFNADLSARSFFDRNEVISQLVSMLGQEILDEKGHVKRKKVASIVFNDPPLLDRLNNLIHPLVHNDFKVWLEKQDAAYILYETAILFNSQVYKQMDKVIVVTAPLDLRLARVCLRDDADVADVLRRMKFQTPQEELEKMADYILCNDDNSLIIPQVIELDQVFRSLAEKNTHSKHTLS
jgi:dephospho-CoA kinase